MYKSIFLSLCVVIIDEKKNKNNEKKENKFILKVNINKSN